MTAPLVINFNGDPIAKGRARMSIGQGGRPIVYTPAKTRKFEAALQYAAQEAMNGRLRFLGAVMVDILAVLPIPQSWSKKKQAAALAGELLPTSRPDVDNYQKLAFDALNAVVFNDDAQVVKATVVKAYGANPLLRIEVTPLSPEGTHETRQRSPAHSPGAGSRNRGPCPADA